mmetsp:Transcript_35946/g.86898  ORF Transcript_35946/g.86898 Transcript_35946/m.86898 type:complete len:86 (-) Transcript_35946:461-718(-)
MGSPSALRTRWIREAVDVIHTSLLQQFKILPSQDDSFIRIDFRVLEVDLRSSIPTQNTPCLLTTFASPQAHYSTAEPCFEEASSS